MDVSRIAVAINQLRVFPRFMIITYGFMTWEVTEWFMVLPDPSNSQSTLVAIVWGAGAVWFGAYANTGGK